MSRRHSLLESVRGLLERTYAMQTGLGELAPFVIGDQGLRQLYGARSIHEVIGSASGAGARLLVRETEAGVRASVYFPDALIRCLERDPPQGGIDESNVDAFATLVEELDHLLLLAARSREHRPVSLLELELHANVSKHLVLSRFMAGGSPRLSEARKSWLRYHLFEKVRFCDDDPEVRRRYELASRWAVRFLKSLPPMRPAGRVRTLRVFHAVNAAGKVELIERLAA